MLDGCPIRNLSKIPLYTPKHLHFHLNRKYVVSNRGDVPIVQLRQRGIRWHVRLTLSASRASA